MWQVQPWPVNQCSSVRLPHAVAVLFASSSQWLLMGIKNINNCAASWMINLPSLLDTTAGNPNRRLHSTHDTHKHWAADVLTIKSEALLTVTSKSALTSRAWFYKKWFSNNCIHDDTCRVSSACWNTSVPFTCVDVKPHTHLCQVCSPFSLSANSPASCSE